MGPSSKVETYPGIFINEYNFHTVQHGARKSTMNWGVCVRGSNSEDAASIFYGHLNEVLVLTYHTVGLVASVILFNCPWFDSPPRGTHVHPTYNLVDVNFKRKYPNYDPFVLAQQVTQVYYCPFPGAPQSRSN